MFSKVLQGRDIIMKRVLVTVLYSLLSVLLILAFAFFIPLRLPFQLDFQVLWHANLRILQGGGLYDVAGHAELPFPYPPWYALSTLYLAMLPIQVAARLWLGLNLGMLFGAIWLITSDHPPRLRLITFLLAPLFPPVLGTLLVGQFVLPVFLGAALLIYSLRRQSIWLTMIAAALLTFKPHLGLLPLLAGTLHLWRRGDQFGRRTLIAIAGTAAFLLVVGFLADPAWPAAYLRSLLAFRSDTGVDSCDLCASLAVSLYRLATGTSNLAPAVPIGAVLLLACLGLWVSTRPWLWKSQPWLIAAAILTTLLASPYLLNYDYVLLLIPLTLLATRPLTRAEQALLALAYLLSWLALGVWGRDGNLAFALMTVLLLIMAHRHTRQLDDSSRSAYNHRN